jgi:hypothetical protein
MDRNILNFGKMCIQNNDKESLINAINNIETNDYKMNYEYMFSQLLYYSCTHKKRWAVELFIDMYKNRFDLISRIGLKHTLIYAKYLHKEREDIIWYESLYKSAIINNTR